MELFDLYDTVDFSPVGAVSADSREEAEALGAAVLGAPVVAVPSDMGCCGSPGGSGGGRRSAPDAVDTAQRSR